MAETHALDYKIDIKDELPTEHKLDIEAISPREEKPAALSRNPFKRRREKRKKMALEKLKDEIPDPREPNIKFIDHLVLLKIIGFKNWVLIFFATIGAGGAGVIGLCFQFILGDLINSLATIMSDTTALRNEVNSIAGKFAIVALGAVIANFMNQFFNTLASETISRTLKQRYFESLTAQEMAFFDIKKVGQLACIASDDVAVVQEIYTSKWSTFFQQIVQVVVGLILAFISSWKMTLVIISTSPIIFVLICGVSQGIKMLAKKTSESNEHASSIATEIISSIKTVRSMGGEPKERIRYRNDLKKVHRYGLFKSILQGGVFFILSFTIWGTVALSFWFGGGLTVDGEISVGSMFRVFGLSLMAVMALSNAGTFFTEYARAIQSQTSLLKVIRRVPEIPFKGGKTIENLRGDISIKNIDFIYPARPNITVLKNFSLEIKTGQAVAFVGPSGSGKSTIVGLIERFYNPVRGQISIDNVDISELDPMWLHQVVGIVNQEPTLFACSIRDNISYACRRPVTQEEIEEAAKAANCHSFILDLPDGYNTLLGEKGVSLSGGQKQRIAIARALLQDPKILLLDEATSALDTESEALVQAALDKLMKGRTTICIAHRLSTVKNSDMLCVLSKGILVEKGKHEELIQIQDGVYKKLAEKQMMFAH